MKFRVLVLELHLPQNFCHTHTDTLTDRHFPEIVKSCSGHPKTFKSIKNRILEICTKPILTSIYIEEKIKTLKIHFGRTAQVKKFEGSFLTKENKVINLLSFRRFSMIFCMTFLSKFFVKNKKYRQILF